MTVAQSEETCVVSGMPRAAILKGYANKIISDSTEHGCVSRELSIERGRAQFDRSDKTETTGKARRQERKKRKDTCFFKSHLTV